MPTYVTYVYMAHYIYICVYIYIYTYTHTCTHTHTLMLTFAAYETWSWPSYPEVILPYIPSPSRDRQPQSRSALGRGVPY